jgi:hypothetical protein
MDSVRISPAREVTQMETYWDPCRPRVGLKEKNMRLSSWLVSIAFVAGACSATQKEKLKPDGWTAIPFDNLRTVRVMTTLIVPEIQESDLTEKILEEFEKIGQVHTPTNTSVETLEKALSTPFGFLMLEVAQVRIGTGKLPFLHLSLKMCEMGTLDLNQHKWMGIVWEKERNCGIDASTQEIAQEINVMLQAFAEEFYRVNPETIRLNFYIGKPI